MQFLNRCLNLFTCNLQGSLLLDQLLRVLDELTEMLPVNRVRAAALAALRSPYALGDHLRILLCRDAIYRVLTDVPTGSRWRVNIQGCIIFFKIEQRLHILLATCRYTVQCHLQTIHRIPQRE